MRDPRAGLRAITSLRSRDPHIDVEHLLLALVATDDPAGQALRALGISLDTARDAVTEQHTHSSHCSVSR